MQSIWKLLNDFSTSPPSAFIFCGPFIEKQLAYGYSEASAIAFRDLAKHLAEFAVYFTSTRFILVPSTDDLLPMPVFPRSFPSLIYSPQYPVSFRPPLPPSIQEIFKDFTNVHCVSNPCRLTFKGQRIVICRDDIVEK